MRAALAGKGTGYKWAARYRWWHAQLRKHGLDRKTTILIESGIIGATAGAAALIFNQGVAAVAGLRHYLVQIAPDWLVLPLSGLVGGAICGAFVQFIAPEISGSGIPQVKALLNRVSVKFDLRVAASKLVAGAIALGIGLPLGREGPTVQLGAAMAAMLGRVGQQSSNSSRQLVAAGAGAGLAAAFNAPLAGVMFVVEELQKEASSLTIGSALLACFFAALVSRWMGNHSLDLPSNSGFPAAYFTGVDIPFCFLLGIISGILGGLFNNGIISASAIFDKLLKTSFVVRVGLAGLFCGLLIVMLPVSFRDFAGIRQLIFEGRSWHFAVVVLAMNFLLTVVAYASGAPGGLFAPSLTMGAALGFLIGCGERQLFAGAQHAPMTLALAGMGAVFAAIARVPITATVIVFEMTADFNLLLPLMISAITAYVVGEKVSEGSVYDRLLLMKGVKLIEETKQDRALKAISVERAMNAKVETLPASMKLDEAIAFFSRSKHRGYPVLKDERLVGVVTQSDLLTRTEEGGNQSIVEDVMTPHPVTVSRAHTLELAVSLLDQYNLSRLPVEDKGKLVGIVTRSDIIRALANAGG